MTMVEWTKEQLQEMFGDNVSEQLAFVAGCTKHSYSDTKNPELDGFIVSHESLSKYAKLIVKECCKEITQEPFNAGAASLWLKDYFGVDE